MFQVTGLRSGYGQSEVIKGLDITVNRNETLAIMGRNGMGKTTLFKTLVGLIPATDGKVELNGEDLSTVPTHKRVAKGLAYVPQGRMIFSGLTVLENISTGMETVKGKKVPDEIFELFPVLHDMRRRKGGNLSGGQQQQLAIARALVSNPKILLLDEPTEGIQPSIIKDIGRAIVFLKETFGLAILLVEQYLDFARELADTIAIMDRGRIVVSGAPEQLDNEDARRYLTV